MISATSFYCGDMTDTARTDSTGFIVRRPPEFETLEEERFHRLQRLAGSCRILGQAGFSEGLLGHMTVRDPEDPEHFWANPLGISFNRITVSDLVKVDHEGTLLHGDRPVNPVGVRLHAAVHRARPNVDAVCHCHSTFGSAWSSLGRPVAPITQDTAVFYDQQAIIRDPRVAMDSAAADEFAAAFGQRPVAIQVGHGLFTTGVTIDEAVWRFVAFDKACHVQLLAAAAGEPEQWPAPEAAGLAQALGTSDFAWLSFQTLWDDLVATDASFLD